MAGVEQDVVGLNEGVRVCEARLCLLCGREGSWLYRNLRDSLFDAPGTWGLMRCPEGHLVWLNPRPVLEDIARLYGRYFTHETGEPVLGENSGPAARPRARGVFYKLLKKGLERVLSLIGLTEEMARLSVMTLNGPAGGRLLDVGCGNGRFLATMRDRGWKVLGVEPDAQAVKVAREHFGLDVHMGSVEEMGLPNDAVDVVTLSHVIEHVSDPIATLRECRRILRPNGRVVIVTPNIRSLGHRVFGRACRHLEPPRHLYLFSSTGLRACARRAGLRVLECRTTAREARGIWTESRNMSPEKQSFRVRMGGLAFQILEHLLCKAADVGEEILLIATK